MIVQLEEEEEEVAILLFHLSKVDLLSSSLNLIEGMIKTHSFLLIMLFHLIHDHYY